MERKPLPVYRYGCRPGRSGGAELIPRSWAVSLGLRLILTVVHVPVLYGQGGPPLETDDPGTPGDGRWEINVAGTLEHSAERTLYEAPLADVNYGIGDRVQLKLEIPFLFERDGGSRSGLGNTLVGVKWRVLEDSTTGSALSTYPQLELRTPVLSLDDEQDESSLLLPIELATAWAGLGINAETGYRMIRGRRGELMYGLALGFKRGATIEVLSECNGWSDLDGADSELVCQIGARQELGAHYSLLGALGTGVIGSPIERTRLHMYFGLQSRW
jgi:hypothetical protein